MITDNATGSLRYGYSVSDLNKTTPNGDVYSKKTQQAEKTGLMDYQTVLKSNSSKPGNDSKQSYESKYDFNGELKSDKTKTDENGKKITGEEYFKQKLGDVSETDKSKDVKTGKADEKSEHSKGKHDGFDSDCPLCECDTCKNRRYQDDSNDGGVSFQQATKMSPTEASHRVKSHEMEHVRREQFKAKEEGKKVLSQSVQIITRNCPDCGDVYVAGGLTRTTTKHSNPEYIDLFRVGAEDVTRKGNEFDKSA